MVLTSPPTARHLVTAHVKYQMRNQLENVFYVMCSGGFGMIHNQKLVENATHFYDFREMSPAVFSDQSVRSKYYKGNSKSNVERMVTVAVPGLLKGLKRLHEDGGK